ncbi:MAG: hypothetical protein AABW48_06135 [Nanoarchaeota archaeon]
MGKPKKGDKKGEKKELDFKKIAEDLANLTDKHHITQMGPALTETYLKHAKYTKDGVDYFKDEFNEEEAKKLADKLYDSLGYHIHKRFLKIDDDNYERLKKIKDPNGNPYLDIVAEYHTGLNRKQLQKGLARKKTGNKITLEGLQKLLEEPIGHHAQKVTHGLLDKEHLSDPENMDKVKGAIDAIVNEFKLNKDNYDTSKLYTPQEVLNTYLGLVQEHYSKRKKAH